jgi:hypothetical protein
MKDFVTKEFASFNMTNASYRDLSVGIVNVLNGTYKEIDSDFASTSDSLVGTVFTSFGYPGFYPPSVAFGSEWFDGAQVTTLDILGAINKCKAMGVKNESEIVIDALITQAHLI